MHVLDEIVLTGGELTLRPLTMEDVPGLAEAAGEDRSSYRFTPVPDGRVETDAYVADALARRAAGQRYPFAIVWRGRVVGSTSYLDYGPWSWPPHSGRAGRGVPDAVEVGFTWLAASAQRTRCNAAAKLLLLQHAFETWEVLRVSLKTDARNERSRRAIERLGAVFDGVLRAHGPAADGTVRDTAYYSILAAEWPEVRRGLLARLERDTAAT